jgi:hypothetical protein
VSKPHIKTARPARRYQLGGFIANILTDITRDDPVNYRYITALVEEGESEPCLYVTSTLNPPQRTEQGRFALNVLLGEQNREMGSADEWGEIESFSLGSMGIAAKLYQLGDEQPRRFI